MLNQLPVARLGGKTAIVATKILCSLQDVAPFYRIAEVHLQAIKEKVPIFEGKFRITQDLTVAASKVGDGIRAVFSAGKTVPIVGELHYQACDQAICYPPTSVPVKWELQIRPLDLKRSPEAIQHK